ncbi:MAG TPA: hypothetical protein VGO89_16290, partial [Streptomyces sp.]|nr:hypothetical protein [Streptomyces sp.]
VQEGLTNVLRHAGEVRVELMIAVQSAGEDGELTVLMENPLRRGGTPERTDEDGPRRGGRGLRGIEERAALLGGSAESGSRGESWRMSVRLPLRRADDAASTSAAPGAGSGGAE